MPAVDSLARGRASCARGAWLEAHDALASADRAEPLGADDLELLATTEYMLGRDAAYPSDAGVERTEARVAGVSDGKPVLDDGRVLDVANVVWCTGFGKDLGWIEIPVAGADGWPEQARGVVESSPGLYFVGLPFLHAFASMLIGGVGRDAAHVAAHIAARAAEPAQEASPMRGPTRVTSGVS
jgi:hypothetical protein